MNANQDLIEQTVEAIISLPKIGRDAGEQGNENLGPEVLFFPMSPRSCPALWGSVQATLWPQACRRILVLDDEAQSFPAPGSLHPEPMSCDSASQVTKLAATRLPGRSVPSRAIRLGLTKAVDEAGRPKPANVEAWHGLLPYGE